jgi:lathosterol oxidase
MRFSKYFFYVERIGSRYFLIAGIAFLIFYLILRSNKRFTKIQSRFPKLKDYAREIVYSISTIVIFALVPLLVLNYPTFSRHMQFYTNIHEHGWLYFFLAFPIMFMLHDTYFYWTHRLMHHRKLFNLVHLVHHHSTNPSPWAAYSFHPLEALVEAGIFVLFLMIMPIHPLHLFIFFFFMIVYNVYGHLRFELYPHGCNKNSIGKWINNSVNHNQHHQYFKGNYGLYFTFWDRLMGTLRSDYDKKFQEVTRRYRK